MEVASLRETSEVRPLSYPGPRSLPKSPRPVPGGRTDPRISRNRPPAGVSSASLEARDLRPEGAPATGSVPRGGGGRPARPRRASGLPLHHGGPGREQRGDGTPRRPGRPGAGRGRPLRRPPGASAPAPPAHLAPHARRPRGRAQGGGAGGGGAVAGGGRLAPVRAEDRGDPAASRSGSP